MNTHTFKQHFPRLTRQHEEETAAQRRAELEKHVAEFLRNGGTIQKLPSGLATLDEFGRTPDQRQQHLESARSAAHLGGIAKAELHRRQRQLSAPR